MDKSPDAFRTISEVAEALETPAHVLRFWETRFPQIRPVKRAGGRRYYRPSDLALLAGIKRLLHEEGLTIRGVQKILREQGVRHVAGLSDETSPEEDALISTMSAQREPAEITRLTPREADLASIHALEQEAARAADGDADAQKADQPHNSPSGITASEGAAPEITAQVITFPIEPSQELVLDLFPNAASRHDSPLKDPLLPADDPRQILFPGFAPVESSDDALVSPLTEDLAATEDTGESLSQPTDIRRNFGDLTHQDHHEEAPFAFDIDDDDHEMAGGDGGAIVSVFPPAPHVADQPAARVTPDPVAAEAPPAILAEILDQDAGSDAPPASLRGSPDDGPVPGPLVAGPLVADPAGPQNAAPPGSAPYVPVPGPSSRPALAARLRALPAGTIHPRNEAIRQISHRIAKLRARLDEARHRPN